MREDQMQMALLALTAAFPGLSFNVQLYSQLLNDLEGDFFLKAVFDFILNTKEIFPGTNPIAILREKTLEITRVEVSKHQKKLAQETSEEERKRWEAESETPAAKKAHQDYLDAIANLNKKLEIKK